MSALTQKCPQCDTALPADEGYSPWCHECGWNVAPLAREERSRRVDRLYAAAGRRLGDRLAAELRHSEQLEPGVTVGKLAAYVIAALVHALALVLVVGGAALAIAAFPNVFGLIAAAAMVATGILMRPRLGSLPGEGLVTRPETPTLYGLVADVAQALETRSVDVVAVDESYNASWGAVGLRRRRVLSVGLPLLAALEPQERVALLAHELAHARNGDVTRGVVVGSALGGLEELYGLLVADDVGVVRETLVFEMFARAILRVLSWPVLGLLLLEMHLLMRDSQRAEYLADALAAKVAGTAAMVATHEKLLLETTFEFVVQRRAQARPQTGADVFEQLRRAVRAVPERERERRRRAARLEQARLGVTHPPTGKRIELLEARPVTTPLVRLDEDRSAAIDAELAPLRPGIERKLVDAYRSSLYAA